MNVLITGGKGQLARSLVDTLPESVRVFVPEEGDFDLTDPAGMQAVIRGDKPDCIINTAAYTAVDQAESNPDKAYAINADGAAQLAELCAVAGVRLVQVSTDYVFDGNASRPWKPNDEPRPLGVYGASKAKGEAGIRERLPEATIVRTAWLYSRYGSNFVKTMLGLLSDRNELSVVDDQVGAPTWARNLADVLWHFALHPAAGAYHYTDAGVASWYDFATAIAEEGAELGLLEHPARVLPTDTESFRRPAKRPAYSVLDCRTTHGYTGFAPEHWRVALRKMLGEIAAEVAS